MEVKQNWKDQSHILTLKWGEGRILKIHLGKEQMFLTTRLCPDGVAGTIRNAYYKAQETGRYSEFVKVVLSAATESTELTDFLQRVECRG